MSKGATATSRCGTINCEDSTIPGNGNVSPPSTTSCSPGLTGQRRRSGFSDRSPAHYLLRYWNQSRSPLLPPVHRDELRDRLKGYRVADAVIDANLPSLLFWFQSRIKDIVRPITTCLRI